MMKIAMNSQAEVPERQAIQEGLITKDELARRLKKHPRTVERWQRAGLIPFIKPGHSVLYHWADVETRLREQFGRN